jgi:hypothetical protein
MKKVKLLMGLAVMVVALLVAAVPADAHSLAVAVDLTGVRIHNFNNGQVFNLVGTLANSGWNDTSSGSSDTGNATASTSVSNDLNSNSTGVMVSEMGDGPLAMNRGKGIAIAVDATLVGVCNFNYGTVSNMVFTGANSGLNETTGKEDMWPHFGFSWFPWFGGDEVESDTGNAIAKATVSTNLNSNDTFVAVCDFENGPKAINWERPCRFHCFYDRCGCDPDPVAVAVDLTAVKVSNFNIGSVMNMVFTGANTGWNDTSGGSSDTGDARATASVATTLNTNHTCVMVSEGGSGALAMNNARHGGLAIAVEADLVKVDNMNLGYVANFVGTLANSGGNTTSGGSSGTGSAIASASVTNNVNSNSTFIGISGSDSAAAVNGGSTSIRVPCDGPIDVCNPDGVVAVNDGKGTAIAADIDAVSVSNTNVAEVDNVVVTSANTGGNETGDIDQGSFGCGQDDGGDSSTGNASATSTVENTVNSNSTTVVIGGN